LRDSEQAGRFPDVEVGRNFSRPDLVSRFLAGPDQRHDVPRVRELKPNGKMTLQPVSSDGIRFRSHTFEVEVADLSA
jgi:hypothetical protein